MSKIGARFWSTANPPMNSLNQSPRSDRAEKPLPGYVVTPARRRRRYGYAEAPLRKRRGGWGVRCFLALALALPALARAQTLQQDSLALVALYDSTDGASWTDDTNWLTANSLSTWNGVTVSSGRITQLSLSNNNLSGPIPAELGSLTELNLLWFHDNQLTGSIPTELGNLTNLTSLTLNRNQLTGSIPPELGNDTLLTGLNLSGNQLTGAIPAELGNLTSLISLSLYNNQLTGAIPDAIGSLTNLTSLNLENNQLTGSIPAAIGSLTSIQFLYLYSNQLIGSIPVAIGSLTSIQYLYLYDNLLTGAIPDTIGSLTSLISLSLDNNQFVDLPGLDSLSALQYLRIQNNRFTFEDIEPNMSVAGTEFIYGPQDSVGTEQDTTVVEGDSLTLSVAVGGTANQYQWLQGGLDIGGATNDTLIILSVSFADSGSYVLSTTNTVATELTLYSRPINVTVMRGPLSGPYYIGSGGDFASFTEAVDTLKQYGISGSVTFMVNDETFSEQITIPPIAGVSATDTIVFMADTANAGDAILQYSAGSSDNWVVKLDTAQYITFRDLTIQALGTNYARIFELVNDADNINIVDNTLIGTSSNNSSNNAAAIYGLSLYADSTLIEGNTFVQGGYGIYLSGSGTPDGLIIEGNDFSEQVGRAMDIRFYTAPAIGWNTITASLSYSGTGYRGISLSNCNAGTEIISNTIDALKGGYGIELSNTDGTPVTAPGWIANNVIHVGGTGTAFGISMFNSDEHNIHHNSVHVTSTGTGTYGAFYISGGTNVDVRNNIFANSGGGYAYYINTTTAIDTSDYNDLYTPGNYIGAWGGSGNKMKDLSALRAAMEAETPSPAGSEANSVFINPAFTLASNIDLVPQAVQLDDMGTNAFVSDVDVDIDDVARDLTTPDMGAYEFAAAGTPITGTKTVGSGGNYTTFAQALDSLAILGIGGPATLSLLNGDHPGHLTVLPVAGASPTDTLVIQSQSGAASASISYTAADNSANENFVIRLYGADYVTIKDLTLNANGGTNNAAIAIRLREGADNVNILNNVLNGYATTSSSYNLALIYSGGSLGDNRVIVGNTFNNGGHGVYLNTNVSNILSTGTRITNNNFTYQGYRAVYLEDHDAPVVSGNTISTSASASTSYTGIYLAYTDNALRIEQNTIDAVNGGYGIYFNYCDGAGGAQGLTANNSIHVGGTSTSASTSGIYLNSSTFQDIYHNSVNMTTPSTATRAISAINGNNADVRNNIFANSGGGYAFYVNIASAIATTDYNDLYTPGNYIGAWGGDSFKKRDLASWQAASGANNSVFINPAFTSDTNLLPRALQLDSLGTGLSAVTVDIDSTVRHATKPDMGAYEYAPTGTPLAGTHSISTGAGFTLFTDSLVVYGINGAVTVDIATNTYNDVQFTIQPVAGASATNTVTFQSFTGTASDVSINYTAVDATDNYVIDINGADHVTIQNLTLNAWGASYARALQIRGGVDSLSVINNVFYGLGTNSTDSNGNLSVAYLGKSLGDMRTFDGNTFYNGSRGIHYSTDTDGLQAKGTKVVNNTFSDQYYRGVYLDDHEAPVISGNTFTTTGAYSSYNGIYASNCDKAMLIDQNSITITGSGTGIYLLSSAGISAGHGRISNNIISVLSSSAYGIYIYSSSNYQDIFNNVISVGGTSTANGIYVNGCDYPNIYHNTVHNTSTATSSGRALYTTGGTAGTIDIQNNILYNEGGGYAYYVNTTTAIGTSDYNDLYAPNSTYLAYWGGTQSDLTALRIASSKDLNSISADPRFVNPGTDYHLTDRSLAIGAGDSIDVAIVGTTDIENSPRPNPVGSSPDLGAYEHTLAQPDITPPAKPANLAAIASYELVALDWDDNTEGDLDYYSVYRSTTDDTLTALSIATGLNVSNYSDNTVSNYTRYYYWATASDTSSNKSAMSMGVSAIPAPTPLQQDSLALVALYDSTDGTNWTNGGNQNWLTSTPLNNWNGVTVTSGRVTQLDLQNKGLNGTFPPEFWNLTAITHIVITYSALTGPIPEEIGNLTALTSITMFNNQLSGTLPDALWGLNSLQSLNIFNNTVNG